MPKTIGERELQLRELAKNTRAGKNARAGDRAATIDGLKKVITKIPASKKGKPRGRR